MVRHQRLDAKLLGVLLHQPDLGLAVGAEAVDRDQRHDAELLHVLDVASEVRHADLERLEVFLLEILLLDAAVHLERADGGDQHGRVGREPGLAAFDVEEFLAAEISAEACLGHDVVAQLQRRGGGEHRVAAVRDVRERTAVDERRRAFEGLHQVGGERLLQQHGHRAVRLEVLGANGVTVPRVRDDDVAEPGLEVVEVARQAEDRHDLGSHRDVEAGLARKTVGDAAERADDLTQRAIVHVHHAAPADAAAVDAQRIAPVDVIVDQRREQIVRRRDGVEVAGEVEVDVLHRHDLRITAAGGTALHAERRPERGLAQA